MRTIQISGKGKIRVKPDLTRITIILEGVYKDYGESLKKSAEDTRILKDLFARHGFDRSDVKTLSFDVDTKYERYQKKDESYASRLVGYEFTHRLKVEFDMDNKRLGEIIYSLANTKAISPQFHISYIVKDQEKSKNELLANAVSDAKTKADLLTKALGVSLGEIQTIDYSWREIIFEERDIRLNKQVCFEASPSGSYDIDIEPDDIEATDTVTIVWTIS